MTTREQRLAALARQDFYFFFWYVLRELYPEHPEPRARYLEAMCFAIQGVIAGLIARLLITIPPRYLKSTCVSVALPAFILGRHPDWEIMVATYGQEFARLHSDQFRRIIESDWYRATFPHVRIARGQRRADEIRTTRGGARKAVSVGGGGTGRGANVLIIDDLFKASDAHSDVKRQECKTFYEETLYSRINDKANLRIISIQQRLREDDFAEYLLEKGSFEHFNLPVIAHREEVLPLYRGRSFVRQIGEALNPERETLKVLEEIRREIGEQAFSAQYLQEPIPPSSALIRFDDIVKCKQPPDREQCAPVVQSWDPAFTDDSTAAFSACTTWGKHQGKWYLLDVYRHRHDFAKLVGVVRRHGRKWNADFVIIESDGSGGALYSQLREQGTPNLHRWGTRGKDKDTRLIDQSARLTGGGFVIPTQVPWHDELRREFRAVPDGKYRDQVDSITQFVDWVHSRRAKGRFNRDPVTGRRRRPKSRNPRLWGK